LSVDEHTIELAGSPAFYRTAPGPDPPTLYVHGVPTSSDDWIPFLERTGGIAPDLIGFGRSGKGGNLDFSIGGLADFLERLLAHLGTDRVKLVVHDWGAPPGLAFAQRHPDRIERIVVCNAVPMFEVEGVRWHLIARLWPRPGIGELTMGAITRGMLGRTLRGGAKHPEAFSDSRVDSIWGHFDQGTQRAILRLCRSADEPALLAAGAELRALEAPALVVWGQSDPWLPPPVGERYAAVLGSARLDRIADAGHWPWLDRPDVIDRVAGFLGTAKEAA
jgi:pimeloyl-ACP methyl ester carboxylesterase